MKRRKVCLVGSFAVGKTSLVRRFVEGIFSERYLTTVGVKIDQRAVECPSGPVTLMVWDIAGEEETTRLRTSYLRGAHGLVAVADATRAETLEQARSHLERAREEAPGAACVLLVNKWDLDESREVPAERIREGLPPGVAARTTSALTGAGVEEAFAALAAAMTGSGEEPDPSGETS